MLGAGKNPRTDKDGKEGKDGFSPSRLEAVIFVLEGLKHYAMLRRLRNEISPAGPCWLYHDGTGGDQHPLRKNAEKTRNKER